MTCKLSLAAGIIANTFLLVGSTFALDIQLPADTALYRPSDLPGYQLVQRNCMTCHSAHYAQSQPPSSPRPYWEATVKKMRKPFGAQFADEDIAPMVDYLVKTYGAERGTVSVLPKTAPPVLQMVAGAAVPDAASLIAANTCIACHAVDKKVVGPAFREIAVRYAGKPDALTTVAQNIRAGGGGKWGPTPMPPFQQINNADAQTLARYVLAQ